MDGYTFTYEKGRPADPRQVPTCAGSAAAHVQGLTGGGSGWIGDGGGNGVPDNSWTLTLLGIAAVSLEVLRRRFSKVAASV